MEKVKDPHYEHRCRVVIQQSAVTRVRPAIKKGWITDFIITNLQPEYISLELFQRVLTDAGKFCALGDFRPSYGRFSVVEFKKA